MTLLRALLLAPLLACNGATSRPAAEPPFTGTSWLLVELDGAAVTVPQGTEAPSLLFFPDGRLAGSTGCNRLMGGWHADGAEGLRVDRLATTRRACPPGTDLEPRVLAALEAVTARRIADGRLLLLAGDRVRAALRPGPPPPTS
jgi:heat shock protein HslJ